MRVTRFFGTTCLFLFFGLSNLAHAYPSDLPEVNLSRNSRSPQVLSVDLTQNVYRYVERDEEYTVQVPYEVSVPYQDWETYYSYENVCRYVSVPHTVCSTHNECHTESTPSSCHSTPSCTTFNGKRICSPQINCAPGGSHQVCTPHESCHTTYSQEYRCEYVSVPRQQWVTRYRYETRYRTEVRHRTVTDKFYDHQWGSRINVKFPDETVLEANETESVLIGLSGSEGSPSAQVRVDSGIYSYQVASVAPSAAGALDVALKMVPKYSADDLGQATIAGLAFSQDSSGRYRVSFKDSGVAARVVTEYAVTVKDVETNETILERKLTATFGQNQVVVPIEHSVNKDNDHLVTLSVSRSGIVLAEPISFDSEARYEAQLNPAPYIDPNGVREFKIIGPKNDRKFVFIDATPDDGKVETKYHLKLSYKFLGFLWSIAIEEVDLDRAAIQNIKVQNGANLVKIPLTKLPHVTDFDLEHHFGDDDRVLVECSVTRTSSRLAGVSPVHFDKEADIHVEQAP